MGSRFFRLCAALAVGWPWGVLLVSAVLMAGAAYASFRMAINTSTEGIFSPEADFIRNVRAYERVFPSKGEPIVVVVDAPTASRARAAADAVAGRLRDSGLFRRIDVPGSEPYFEEAGLLFLEVAELRALQTQLNQARHALNVLATQPDISGIAKFIDLITAGVKVDYEIPALAENFVRDLAGVVRLQTDGVQAKLDWSGLFGLGELQERGKRRFVLAYPVLDKTTVQRVAPALAVARAAAQAASAIDPGREVRIRLTGQAALDQQELDAAFSGALVASVLSFGLVVVTLMLGIRSWRLIIILVVTMVVGSVWTSGLAAVLVEELNLISLAFGVLFFAIGIDFGTHLGLRYMELRADADPGEAITGAVTGEGPAITLSVLCASVGFLSFVPTEYLGLAQLGLISALGMLAAFAVTLLLLPAMLAAWSPSGTEGEIDISRFAAWLRRRAAPIVIIAMLTTSLAMIVATDARVDLNPLNLQDPSSEPVQVYRELARDPATSPYEINVMAAGLEEARGLARRLRAVEGIAQVRTVESFIPVDQEQKRAPVAAIVAQFERLGRTAVAAAPVADLRAPFDKLAGSAGGLAAAAQAANRAQLAAAAAELSAALADFTARAPGRLAALNRALAGDLPGLFEGLRNTAVAVAIDDLPEELRRDWLAPGGAVRVEALPTAGAVADGDAMRALTARVQSVAPTATGVPIIIAEAGNVVRRSFAEAIALTAIAIVAILMVVRRSLLDVLLILTPLVLASIWTIAGAALLGLSFNFANVIVIPVLLGVGVASAIHVVARAREIEQQGQAVGALLDSSTPRAVLLTDANTALAFATLAVSSHRGLFSLGVLLTLATTLSLVASLIVLPAILELLARRRAGACAAGGQPPTVQMRDAQD